MTATPLITFQHYSNTVTAALGNTPYTAACPQRQTWLRSPGDSNTDHELYCMPMSEHLHHCLTTAGSTSSSMSDHWLVRLNGDSKRGCMVSTTCTSIPDVPELPVFQPEAVTPDQGTLLLPSYMFQRLVYGCPWLYAGAGRLLFTGSDQFSLSFSLVRGLREEAFYPRAAGTQREHEKPRQTKREHEQTLSSQMVLRFQRPAQTCRCP